MKYTDKLQEINQRLSKYGSEMSVIDREIFRLNVRKTVIAKRYSRADRYKNIILDQWVKTHKRDPDAHMGKSDWIHKQNNMKNDKTD